MCSIRWYDIRCILLLECRSSRSYCGQQYGCCWNQCHQVLAIILLSPFSVWNHSFFNLCSNSHSSPSLSPLFFMLRFSYYFCVYSKSFLYWMRIFEDTGKGWISECFLTRLPNFDYFFCKRKMECESQQSFSWKGIKSPFSLYIFVVKRFYIVGFFCFCLLSVRVYSWIALCVTRIGLWVICRYTWCNVIYIWLWRENVPVLEH